MSLNEWASKNVPNDQKSNVLIVVLDVLDNIQNRILPLVKRREPYYTFKFARSAMYDAYKSNLVLITQLIYDTKLFGEANVGKIYIKLHLPNCEPSIDCIMEIDCIDNRINSLDLIVIKESLSMFRDFYKREIDEAFNKVNEVSANTPRDLSTIPEIMQKQISNPISMNKPIIPQNALNLGSPISVNNSILSQIQNKQFTIPQNKHPQMPKQEIQKTSQIKLQEKQIEEQKVSVPLIVEKSTENQKIDLGKISNNDADMPPEVPTPNFGSSLRLPTNSNSLRTKNTN